MSWKSTIIAEVPVAEASVADGGSRLLTLDLYVPDRSHDHPEGPGEPPLLVYIHGGGWRQGHNDRPPGFRSILRRGLAIASLQYRFSHEASGEQTLEDLYGGIRVARRAAADAGCDVSRWFVWGISAGGHLSSLVAHRLSSGESTKQPNLPLPSAAACWCGVFDIPTYRALDGVSAENRDFVAEVVDALTDADEQNARRLSPITYVSGTSVPHYLVHGADDVLVPPEQSRIMRDALHGAGVRAELFEVPGRGHAMPPDDSEEMHRTLDFLLSCGDA